MRSVSFHQHARDPFVEWQNRDPKLVARIGRVISEMRQNPFTGIGKSEPLKHQLKGCWSRRISDEHRLVHVVSDAAIAIISCNDHY